MIPYIILLPALFSYCRRTAAPPLRYYTAQLPYRCSAAKVQLLRRTTTASLRTAAPPKGCSCSASGVLPPHRCRTAAPQPGTTASTYNYRIAAYRCSSEGVQLLHLRGTTTAQLPYRCSTAKVQLLRRTTTASLRTAAPPKGCSCSASGVLSPHSCRTAAPPKGYRCSTSWRTTAPLPRYRRRIASATLFYRNNCNKTSNISQ
jgi:hypothetical protein